MDPPYCKHKSVIFAREGFLPNGCVRGLPMIVTQRLSEAVAMQTEHLMQVHALAAVSHGYTQPAGSATYITQTLRAGTVQEHAGTVVIFGYATDMLQPLLPCILLCMIQSVLWCFQRCEAWSNNHSWRRCSCLGPVRIHCITYAAL